MARNITYREALNEALAQEMERDETVIVMGEDNAGRTGAPGEDDAWGGVLGVTKGLYHKFPGRVLDTPISESAFIGAAIGAATAGMRPVAELMFVDFMGVCFDQIYNQAAKFRYMFGGKAVTPVVIRTMYGAGLRAAAQHSQCLYPLFTHIPGLKVVMPSTPYDAKGMMIQAIRDNDPVMFFEHKALYDLGPGTRGELRGAVRGGQRGPRGRRRHDRDPGPDGAHLAGGGRAARRGRRAVRGHRPAHHQPAGRGHRAGERRGHRPAGRGRRGASRCNIATDISALVARKAFGSLRAPIEMVTAPHTPVPFSNALEDIYIPDAQRVVNAVKTVTGWSR